MDEVLTVQRLPRENEEIRALKKRRVLGGNACNSAQILAQLGDKVSLISSLADDHLSHWIDDELDRIGIEHHLCPRSNDYVTPLSTILLKRDNGSRTIVHYRDLPELQTEDLQRIALNNFSWIHVEGRNIEVLGQVLPHWADTGISLSLEIEKPRQGIEQLSVHAHNIIISSHYLDEHSIDADSCLKKFRQLNPRANLVATLGEKGAVAMDKSGKIITIGAHPVTRVADTIGAGDCFIAGIIHASMRQQSFESALNFASQLVANKIQRHGMTINLEAKNALHL